MNCPFCNAYVSSGDEAIDAGWIPYFWTGYRKNFDDQYVDDPVCSACAERELQLDSYGEWELKREQQGETR